MIHITDGQTDKILDIIPDEEYWGENHHKSLKDYLETFNFITFADKRYSQYLIKRNRVIISDDDGRFVEFIIHEAIKYHDGNGLRVEIYSQASYLEDLKKGKVIRPGNTGNKTNVEHATDTLNGTLWKPGTIHYVGTRSFDIDNYTDPYSFSKRLATEFKLELQFRLELQGNRILGRYMDMIERIGEWRGREIEFSKDLINIMRRETGDIVTALLGIGPAQENGNRLEELVEDEEALERWGRGQHIIEHYEPQSNDSEMSPERLIELTRNELEKRVNALIEYETTIADLESVPGMQNMKIRFGDTIRIKDTKFNPPLYLEARIHTMDRSPKDKSRKQVSLGDYIEYTEEEVNANQNALRAEIEQRIKEVEERNQVFVETYAEKKIPELITPPDPNEFPKYIDISGDAPQLMLWDGEQFIATKGEKGDPGPNYVGSETEFETGYNPLEINEKINNAVITTDGTGMTIKDGSFFLEDDQSDTKYSIVANTNLINDHSFELVKKGNLVNGSIYTIPAQPDHFRQWGTVGVPRLLSFINTEVVTPALFGYQSGIVNSSNYLRQSAHVNANATYTLSAYFLSLDRILKATPRLRIRQYNLEGAIVNTWIKDFEEVGNNPTRYSFTFTTPTDVPPGHYFTFEFLATDSNWCLVDGAQLVESSFPVLYDPEINLWNLMNGAKGYNFVSLSANNVETVVNSGSNTLGTFVMYSNGRMEVYRRFSIYIPSMDDFRLFRRVASTQTFPMAFIEPPNVEIDFIGSNYIGGVSSVTETDYTPVLFSLANPSPTSLTMMMRAVGKWGNP